MSGIWPLNTDMFMDENFWLPAVTDGPLQDTKHPGNFGPSDSHNSNSNLHGSSQRAKSDLTRVILFHVNPAETRSFQKQKHLGRVEGGKQRRVLFRLRP
jgi:hypothetical protein